jgi:hypothetical protein
MGVLNEKRCNTVNLLEIMKNTGLYSCSISYYATGFLGKPYIHKEFILWVEPDTITYYVPALDEILTPMFNKNAYINRFNQCFLTKDIHVLTHIQLFRDLFGVDITNQFNKNDINENVILNDIFGAFEYSYKAI